MLGKKEAQTYYAITTRYDQTSKNIITILAETDGTQEFNFIASFEKTLDAELQSQVKKLTNYSFSAQEITSVVQDFSAEISLTIKSILAENNIPQGDIDFICLENLALGTDFTADIATPVFKALNIPVIYNLDLSDNSEFLQRLALARNIEEGVIINLDQAFDIYKLNSSSHLVAQSMGYNILHYLSMYLNIATDEIAHLIAQGQVDEGIINTVSQIKNIEDLQKELTNLLVFSSISNEDKLKTAFSVVKDLLLANLTQFDKNTQFMLIGNTTLVEELNQALKEVYEEVHFLKDQSQRQNTLINEHMAYLGAKKYMLEDYNNGVKLS